MKGVPFGRQRVEEEVPACSVSVSDPGEMWGEPSDSVVDPMVSEIDPSERVRGARGSEEEGGGSDLTMPCSTGPHI